MEGPQQRVLVVDDEPAIRNAVRIACQAEGYVVAEADTGKQVMEVMEAFDPHIVLLDLMLPDTSGFDVCKELRAAGWRVPIVILSGKNDEIDVVVGLEIGADDYLFKPFRPRELTARVAAHLRKARLIHDGEATMHFKEILIDVNQRRVFRGEHEIELTNTEFDLLSYLASHAGDALSRDDIMSAVWGYEQPLETRAIDVHIRNLRLKLEDDPAKPSVILTIPGLGYRFVKTK